MKYGDVTYFDYQCPCCNKDITLVLNKMKDTTGKTEKTTYRIYPKDIAKGNDT